MLPTFKEYEPILSEIEVLDYMIQLGYDLDEKVQRMTLSNFNVKYLP